MVEPKAKKKYKTKKEKDATVEELVIVAQTMVGGEFRDEEAQNLKDLVEEAT
jgi:protein required for attachment to host cells